MKKIPMRVIPEQRLCSCYECPFLRYNSDYGMSYDSGFDCEKTGDRIANDGHIQQYNRELEEWNKSQQTLFPMSEDEKPFDLFTIPPSCPLEEVCAE